MQSKICVLQVIPNLDVSGASQGCIDIANFLSEKKYSSYILTSTGDKISEVNNFEDKVFNASVHSKNPFMIFLNILLLSILIIMKKISLIIVILTLFLSSCGIYKYSPVKDEDYDVEKRVRKNIEEGKGITFGKSKNIGGTFDFSSSTTA